jgi:superfamily II DNA/RNA helicase
VKRQAPHTLLFSATIPAPIATLARRYQRDALRIATSGDGDRHRDIEYQVVSTVPRERDLAVVNLLRFHDRDQQPRRSPHKRKEPALLPALPR